MGAWAHRSMRARLESWDPLIPPTHHQSPSHPASPPSPHTMAPSTDLARLEEMARAMRPAAGGVRARGVEAGEQAGRGGEGGRGGDEDALQERVSELERAALEAQYGVDSLLASYMCERGAARVAWTGRRWRELLRWVWVGGRAGGPRGGWRASAVDLPSPSTLPHPPHPHPPTHPPHLLTGSTGCLWPCSWARALAWGWLLC